MHIDAHQHFWNFDKTEYDWIDEHMSAIAYLKLKIRHTA
jgi:predicted TIM-barrel fold metal-dependent hydrolase